MYKVSEIEMIIGIDVSKAKLDCLWLKDATTGVFKAKVFTNNAPGHQALIEWARHQTKSPIESLHFAMEATGVYSEAIAQALYRAGAKVSVLNPAHVRDYAKSIGVRTKTDKKDSWVIARYGATQQPRLWQPEPTEIRHLKALMSRYEALKEDVQRERNRREKAEISQVSEVLLSIDTVLEHLIKEKKQVEKLINRHIDRHPTLKHDRELLESIPGIGPVVSRYMLSILRSREFESAPQSAAFLGLVPIHHESGSSVRGRARLSKTGNPTVRAKLYMAAVVAIHHNPDVQRQYERLLKNGKTKMSALGAAMRKLVHICFGVLKHQTPYHAQSC